MTNATFYSLAVCRPQFGGDIFIQGYSGGDAGQAMRRAMFDAREGAKWESAALTISPNGQLRLGDFATGAECDAAADKLINAITSGSLAAEAAPGGWTMAEV